MNTLEQFRHLVVGDLLTALDFMPVGVSIVDTQLRAVYWNRAFIEILDFPESLVSPGVTLEDLFRFNAQRGDYGPGDAEEQVRTRVELARRFEPHQFVRTRKDGRIIEVTGRVMYDAQGAATGFVSLYQDVTKEQTYEHDLERKHAELSSAYENLKRTQLQLLQSEKMASVGHLAAGIAHEINNPICFVMSDQKAVERYFGEVLRLLNHCEALETEMTESCRQKISAARTEIELDFIREDIPALFQEIHSGLVRVKEIVSQLKVFAQDRPDQCQPADMRELMDRALDIAVHGYGDRIEVEKQYAEVPPLDCFASEVSHVFLGMLTNAGQAIEGKGKIVLRIYPDGDMVVAEIDDTGAGIKPEDLPHIFDPFFTTKPVGTGTGMGLAVAYHVIKKHGGHIVVKSTPNQGSSFTIRLPQKAPEYAI